MKTDRVLVPLDGSPLAERALPVATALLSERPGATMILMRAAATTPMPGADLTDLQVTAMGEAHSYLRTLADRLHGEGLAPALITSVWYSSPAHAIAEAARTQRANVIVMSGHFPSELRRSIQNSLAAASGTYIPILLVPIGNLHLDLQRAAA
jgi:nucleotide-binding universal stress UspA family protein